MKNIFYNCFALLTVLILTQSCNDKVKTEVSLKNDTLVTKVISDKDKEDLKKMVSMQKNNMLLHIKPI